MRVGIPRALFYHYYYPLWHRFYSALGAEVVVSAPTNRALVNLGVARAVDEACLPVKLSYGHALSLAGRVDFLLAPRLVSVEEKAYTCPKLLGLPDMWRAALPELPPLIDVTVDLRRGRQGLARAVEKAGRCLTGSRRRIAEAWREAAHLHQQYRRLLLAGRLPAEATQELLGDGDPPPAGPAKGVRLAVLGHGYNIYDRHVSMDLIGKLRRLGAVVETPEMLAPEAIERGAARLPKRIFWTLGRRVLGAALHYLERPDVAGLVHVTSFGCGPDSLVGELVERYARRAGRLPSLFLTVDEHTGEAGVNTRLEAFMDMLARRDAS